MSFGADLNFARRPESSGKKLLLPMCGPCVQQILGKRCGIHGFQLLEFSQAPQDTVSSIASSEELIFEDLLRCWPKAVADM